MSLPEKDDIINYLTQDELSRNIARVCFSGMSTEKIVVEVSSYFSRKGTRVDYDDLRSRTASRLQNMEQLGILTYDNLLWKTTEKAKAILKKYFGMT